MNDTRVFSFSSRFSNNAVIVIDALVESDFQTARHLADDLAPLTLSDGSPYCRYHKVSTVQELLNYLGSIEIECKKGLKPIIHFEAHGSQDAGIQVGEVGEWLNWNQLSEALITINVITKNNLGIVMASCFGFYMISSITIEKPSPFYFLIGSERTVEAGHIDDVMGRFYRKLFDLRSLDDAMTEVQEQFRQFHSERFFCIAFGKYLKKACIGKGASTRSERLLTEVMASGIPKSRENLRKFRRIAKNLITSSENQRNAFIRTAQYFLHGKVPMSFDEFERFVKRTDA